MKRMTEKQLQAEAARREWQLHYEKQCRRENLRRARKEAA